MNGGAFLRKQYERMFKRRRPVVARRVAFALAIVSLAVSIGLAVVYGMFDRKHSTRVWSARFASSSMFLLATSFFIWIFDELIARPFAIFHWSDVREFRILPALVPEDEDTIPLSIGLTPIQLMRSRIRPNELITATLLTSVLGYGPPSSARNSELSPDSSSGEEGDVSIPDHGPPADLYYR